MTEHIFGKAITRGFTSYIENTEIIVSTDSPSIYLFSSEPSLTVARAGTEALQTLSSWTRAVNAPFLNAYNFAAVSDPDPTGATDSYTYWEAINYYPEAGGQKETVIRNFAISRAQAGEDSAGTSIDDVKKVYPAIESYLTDTQLTDILDSALEQMKIDLEAVKLSWGKIKSQSRLKLTLAYLCIAMSSESQIMPPQDKFTKRAEIYNEKYAQNLKKISLSYDSNGNSTADTKQKAGMSFMIANR